MRPKLVTAYFDTDRPQKKLPRSWTWLWCAAFAALGMTFGLWRTPPPNAALGTPAARVAETPEPGSGGAGSEARQPQNEPDAGTEVKLVTYTVQPGDTLTSIASMFNTSVDSIACINNLPSPDRINPGKQLSVMTNSSGLVVRVSSGDTLWDIARRYGIAVEDIVRANKLASSEEIQVGQVLLLPGAAARSAQAVSRSSTLVWPANGYVSSGFGWRIHPVSGEELFHEGIDIAADEGSNVYAAAAGTVTFRGWDAGYGRLIVIQHDGGLETRYGHLSGYEVAEGQYVYAGQTIGYVGQSGNATGPNLHFEVRKNGKVLDPGDYLP